jgi:hypothetical protein
MKFDLLKSLTVVAAVALAFGPVRANDFSDKTVNWPAVFAPNATAEFLSAGCRAEYPPIVCTP